MGATRADKELYFTKLRALIEEYPSLFIVNIDNVSSQQCHAVRQALRGKGVVLMGKNTMVRRALRTILPEFPQYEKVLPFVRGNIGFVFTKDDLKEIREQITSNRVAAPARAGAVAPDNVFVPAGNTGMEPGKTSFFQALGIPTKIARGTIEIVNDVQVVAAGTKVGTSEATLLNMLNISPFTYGMTVVQIYDNGAVFAPNILDIEEDELLGAFQSAIKTIAALSLATGLPTIASVMHSVVNTYKDLLAVAVATDIDFEAAAKVSNVSVPRLQGCKKILSTGDYLLGWLYRGPKQTCNIHTLNQLFSLERCMLTHSGQGVPCQPRGLCRRRPRRCCRWRRCCPRRRGRQGGGGGVGRGHGLRPLRLSLSPRRVLYLGIACMYPSQAMELTFYDWRIAVV